MNLQHGDLTLLNTPLPVSLAPGDSLTYYYETTLSASLVNTATVEADPSDNQGNSLGTGLVNSQDPAEAEVILIIDPPSAIKTVTPSGIIGMEWKMVWINDSSVVAPDVTVYDEIPVGTTFEAMPAGPNVSADGVYCEARGSSTTDVSFDNNCYYETPSTTYPRGRIIWNGVITADPGLTTEDTANNEVVIRFVSVLDDPSIAEQSIENQATSDWDFDNNGTTDTNVLTRTPTGADNTLFIGTPPPPKNIPTLSEWMLMLLVLLLLMTGKQESLRLLRRK